MTTNALLAASMFFYVLYIFLMALMMVKQRKKAVRDKRIEPAHFKAYKGQDVPEDILIMARHFDNQFQLPMLFLITGSVLLNIVNLPIWVAVVAWAFVLSRILHTYVHLGANHPLTRAKAYALGLVFILLLWFKIMITFL